MHLSAYMHSSGPCRSHTDPNGRTNASHDAITPHPLCPAGSLRTGKQRTNPRSRASMPSPIAIRQSAQAPRRLFTSQPITATEPASGSAQEKDWKRVIRRWAQLLTHYYNYFTALTSFGFVDSQKMKIIKDYTAVFS